MTPEQVVYVVGFSGSVSEGAAAIKSPVFEIDGRCFSGDPDAPPRVTHDWAEIEEYRQRGLLSLITEKRRREPDHVFLYAHPSFLYPSRDAYDLTPVRGTLDWDKRLEAFYDYMHRDRAVALLGRWGEILLEDAKESFAGGRFQRAKESAMRARFGATREHPEARREAHCYVAAARLGLGEDIYGVLRSVAVDSSREDARKVELKARGLFDRFRRWRSGGRLPIPDYPEARFSLQVASAR